MFVWLRTSTLTKPLGCFPVVYKEWFIPQWPSLSLQIITDSSLITCGCRGKDSWSHNACHSLSTGYHTNRTPLPLQQLCVPELKLDASLRTVIISTSVVLPSCRWVVSTSAFIAGISVFVCVSGVTAVNKCETVPVQQQTEARKGVCKWLDGIMQMWLSF